MITVDRWFAGKGVACGLGGLFWLALVSVQALGQEPLVGNLRGQVTDATTGQPLLGATVTADGRAAVTDAQGNYAFSDLETTGLKVEFSAEPTQGRAPLRVQFNSTFHERALRIVCAAAGYVSSTNTAVEIRSGETSVLNLPLSPNLADLGQLRLVLTWQDSSKDLDAHLLTPRIDGVSYHVYWARPGNLGGAPYARLDVDQAEGYGPETITIGELQAGTYQYYVQKYAGAGSLAGSGAVIQVYDARGLVQTIPLSAVGQGSYWHVCAIDGATGSIAVINEIVSRPPIASASLLDESIPANLTAPWLQVLSPSLADTNFTYAWDFGDGQTSNLPNPEHLYEKPGIYDVNLVIYASDGRQASLLKPRYIQARESSAPDQPVLTIIRAGDSTVTLTWSTTESGFVLEQCEDLLTGSWVPVVDPKSISKSSEYFLSVNLPAHSTALFFRLRKP